MKNNCTLTYPHFLTGRKVLHCFLARLLVTNTSKRLFLLLARFKITLLYVNFPLHSQSSQPLFDFASVGLVGPVGLDPHLVAIGVLFVVGARQVAPVAQEAERRQAEDQRAKRQEGRVPGK